MTGFTLAVFFLLASLTCVATATWALPRRRSTPAAGALAVSLYGVGAWGGADGLLHLGLPDPVEAGLFVLQYVGVNAAITGSLCIAWAVADPTWRAGRRRVLALAAVPALIVAAVATDPWHHLFFTSTSSLVGHPRPVFGPLFWVHTLYCYGLFAWGVGHLVRAWWRASSLFRRQIGCSLLGAVLPVPLNLVAILLPGALGGVDCTPMFFVATGLVFAYAIFRQGLLRVVPVARSQVVDTLDDGVLVVDAAGRLVDANTAARVLLRRVRPDLPGDLLGLPAVSVFDHRAVSPLLSGRAQVTVEVRPGLHLDLRSRVHRDDRGHVIALVVTARDVSDAVAAERRLREQLATIEALQERLQEDAVRDPLTGLHNRRHVLAELDRALASGEPLGVVLLDVDHFKSVNDTHGHQTGDDVLCTVSRRLREATREQDTVARYGGEEFLVLLPGADAETARQRAEELRVRCEAGAVPLPRAAGDPAAAQRVRVTVSAGVAVSPVHGSEARTLVAAADGALYAAKAAGRNRVVAAV
ncbi:hypothetical protein NUM3379_07060 [Kineococcus sp. NUM-3379]